MASPKDSETAAGAVQPMGRELHRMAVLLACVTFVLIFVGGLVTSTGSALAVPDWPLSFGMFFPRMEGGVLYEHGHRMVAGAVAILTLVLMVWALRSRDGLFVRRLAPIALGLVLAQAVLGGLTVLLKLPLTIAVAHAATAQAFFCLTIAIVLRTDPRWTHIPSYGFETISHGARNLAAITTGVIYAQIVIGAVMRHMGAGLAIPDFPLSFGRIVPPLDSIPEAINFAHRLGALAVIAMVAWTTARAYQIDIEEPILRRPALALVGLTAVQVSLGAITVWSAKAVIPATTHVAVGAAVLAASLTLTLRIFELTRGAQWQSRPGVVRRAIRVAPREGAAA